MPRLDTLWYDIEARTEHLSTGLAAAERRLQKFAGLVRAHPAAALGALASTAVMVGIEAARMADRFDTAMRKVAALLPGIGQGMGDLRAQVLAMSREVPVGPEQLAQGLEAVVKAGERDPAKAIERLRTAVTGVAVSGQDMSVVVEQLDTVMDAFGPSAGTAAQALDLFAKAGQQGQGAGQVMQTVTQLAAPAHAAGVSLKELVAAVVAMGESGVTPTMTIRALRGAFGGVAADTHTLGLMMDRLGGRIKMTAEGLQLTGAFASIYAQQLDGLSAAAGTAGRVEHTLNGSLDNQWKIVKNQLGAEMIALGQEVLPSVSYSVRALNGLLQTLSGTIQGIHASTAAATISTLSAALRSGGLSADDQAKAVGRLRDALEDLARGEFGRKSSADLLLIGRGINALRGAGGASPWGQSLEEVQREVNRILQERGYQGAAPALSFTEGRNAVPLYAARTDAEIKAGEQALQDLQHQLDQLTVSAGDETRHALDQLVAKLQEAKVPTDEWAAGIRRLREALGQKLGLEDWTRQIDELTRAVDQADQKVEMAPAAREALGGRLGQTVMQMKQYLGTLQEGSQLRRDAGAQLARLVALQDKLYAGERGRTKQTKSGTQTEQERAAALAAQARNIEAAARGALQLAQAFGIVDQTTAAALENVAQIGASIPTLVDAIHTGGAGGIISAGLPILGGLAGLISSLTGSSPEEQARREALQRNSDAIAALTRQLGEFGLQVTGKTFTGIEGAVSGVTGAFAGRTQGTGALGEAQSGVIDQLLRGALSKAGVSFADFQKLLQELGLTFDGTLESLRQVDAALKQVELTQFAQTFSGQLRALQAEFELFDITDPIAQLKKLRDLVSNGDWGSPALAGALAGLDLSTPEGRAAADQAIQALFGQLQAGTLTPAQLGGLSPDEFLAILQQIEQTIDAANKGTGTSTTENWGVNRSITDVTANVLASTLTTIAYWDQQTAEHTAAILDAMVRSAGVQPPTLAELDAYARAAVVTIGPIVVNVSGALSEERARATGDAVGEAVVEALDRKLGQRQRARLRAQGSAVLNW